VDSDRLLSVVLLYDQPCDARALDEALFSLAIQDHTPLEVVVALPACGRTLPRQVEQAVQAQPWPEQTRAWIVSVPTRTSPQISADLINAGLLCATGRYVAFLPHQHLVYQHSYAALIERLQSTDAVVAFGGVRRATHEPGHRHWMVEEKKLLQPGAARLGRAIHVGQWLHSFVADRERLTPDCLLAHEPGSQLAVSMFLLRLALHPRADFTSASGRLFESRIAAQFCGKRKEEDDSLPATADVRTLLTTAGLRLRPEFVCADVLFAEAVEALSQSVAVGGV
jgi:hypothetical protein